MRKDIARILHDYVSAYKAANNKVISVRYCGGRVTVEGNKFRLNEIKNFTKVLIERVKNQKLTKQSLAQLG